MTDGIDVAASRSEVYEPSAETLANANVPDYLAVRDAALADPVGFWDARAKELIDWYEPYTKVLDTSNAPFFQWFLGGKTNVVHNAIDRHLQNGRKDKVAIIWEGEDGESRTYTYAQLAEEVNRFANVLKSVGVKKGDTVTVYMGRVVELPVAMLAIAKIGAIHSVVYGGFSEQALADRINDAQSKVVVTCDGAWLRNKTVNLKDITDEAVAKAPGVEKVIVYQRTGQNVQWQAGRDFWWHELREQASPECPTEAMNAEDPMFILYTSGSTGKPKGQLHTCGGYQVHIATTLKYVFDIQENDVYWCAADPGWITGHSYIVYSPLILGTTSLMYEGAPGYPNPDRWWELIDKYGVTILYTAPTAIRGFMRSGEQWPDKHPMATLRLLGSVGEPINPEAWRWYYKHIGKEKCPIMDTWWQTETGGFMITPTPVVPLKPGSGTLPFAGILADVVREDGSSADANEDGFLVVKHPWPGMTRGIWGDPERFKQTYWSDFAKQGWYFTGDSARRDEDGYFWIIGRMDDVIKVSGYRLGTAEIESALVSHPSVAEAACVGIPDDVKGHVIHAFCILRGGVEGDDELVKTLKNHVRHEVGPIAVPQEINFVPTLPKTRSGKIMRRLLKAQITGGSIGDTSTLEG
ncbi:MAG: acetate--CoA ligase [Caldilineaceae bacterium]|nr:acetate--CoA ligase [Caldilineaceae bacterium]